MSRRLDELVARPALVDATLLATLALAVAGAYALGTVPGILSLGAVLVWALVISHIETVRLTAGKRPLFVPFLVAGFLFAHVFWDYSRRDVYLHMAIVALLGVYILAIDDERRAMVVRRSAPVVLPLLGLVAAVWVAYLAAGQMAGGDWEWLLKLVAAVALVPMVVLYCDSLEGVERFVMWILGFACLQLPVVLLQALGLAGRLPGPFRSFDASRFGGSVSEFMSTGNLPGRLGALRYPGTFGDYELMAEYCGLIVLLCLGIVVFNLIPRHSRLIMAIGVGLAVAGWFTGTRAFVYGAVGGSILMVAMAVMQSGRRLRRLGRVLLGAALTVSLVAWVVPEQVSAAFLGRIGIFGIGGRNPLNRAEFFRAAWRAAGEMPYYGYGARWLAVFRIALNDPRARSPHSLYFTILLAAGYLGLAAVIVLATVALTLTIRTAVRRTGSPNLRWWGSVLAVVVFYWFVNEAKIDFVRLMFVVDFMFAFFGLVAAVTGLAADEARGRAGLETEPEGDAAEGADEVAVIAAEGLA
jgi:hypothetical protein